MQPANIARKLNLKIVKKSQKREEDGRGMKSREEKGGGRKRREEKVGRGKKKEDTKREGRAGRMIGPGEVSETSQISNGQAHMYIYIYIYILA